MDLYEWIKKDSKRCSIIINFPVKMFSDKTGELSISKIKFDNLLSSTLRQYGSYKKNKHNEYFYKNMKYTRINNKNINIKKIIKNNSEYNEKLNLIMTKMIEIPISRDKFPIISEFDYSCKKNILTFDKKFFKINLIDETDSNDEKYYYVEIVFENTIDLLELKEIEKACNFFSNNIEILSTNY